MDIKKYIEDRIDKIFWIILIISLIFIFFYFIIGKNYYMYIDCGSDTVHQYYPYFINEILNIKSGTFSIWNFNYGLGTNILNTNAWTFDIFGILLVLSGVAFGTDKIAYLLVYMQIMKIIVLYILSKKFLSYYLKDRTSICLAAYLGAMNGYIFLWGQHFFLGTACVYITLILCCIERFLHKENKYSSIFLSLAIASLLIYSYYIGYMILIVSAFYFIVRLIYMDEKKHDKLKVFGKCAYCVIIGILISGIVFIPACYNILTTSDRLSGTEESILVKSYNAFTNSFNKEFIVDRMVRMITNNLLVSCWKAEYYELPQLFCTIFIFFFIIQFFIYDLKKCRLKKDYILFGFKILSLYLMIFNGFSGLIFNFFVKPSYRYTFVLMPFLSLMVGIVWEKVIKEDKIDIFGIILYVILMVGLGIFFYSNLRYRVIALVVLNPNILYSLLIFLILGLILIILMKFSQKERNYIKMLFIFLIIISICLENFETTNYREIVTPKDTIGLMLGKSGLENNTGKAIKWLRENDKSFYRVESTYGEFFVFGESFIRQVSSITYYNSTMNPYLKEFYNKIYPESYFNKSIREFNFKTPKLRNRAMPAIYITNTKYILSKEKINTDGIELINTIGDVYIYRNTYTEQVAKFYTKVITDFQYNELDKRQEILYEYVINDDNLKLEENATAKIEEFDLNKPTLLTGKVNCNGKGILLLGVPYQEGWKAYVDGKPVDKIYRVDYGFIGVALEEGEHKVELRYTLPKLEVGVAFTVVGIINLCVLLVIENNRQKVVK